MIAKVKVTVSSQLTGASREAATNDSGDYVFPLLPVAAYARLRPNSGPSAPLNDPTFNSVSTRSFASIWNCKRGEVSETVDVQASGVALDTETASIGQVVTQRQVNDLPLMGETSHNYCLLAQARWRPPGNKAEMRQECRQCHQHQRIAPQPRTTKARWDIEHRYGPGHAGCNLIGGCYPGSSGSKPQHMLGRSTGSAPTRST